MTMSNKAISVSLYRVSSDSFYLDLIIDCPEEYYFSSFMLEMKELVGGKFTSKKYDLTQACFPNTTKDITHFNFRIPIEVLQSDMGTFPNPAIYVATLEAANKEDETDVLTDTLVSSDVNFAYRCMLDDILNPTRCEPVSDEVIRKYLLLYGHQAAMAVEDFETAEAYYKLINNCFSRCGVDYRDSNRGCPTCGQQPKPTCNCGK